MSGSGQSAVTQVFLFCDLPGYSLFVEQHGVAALADGPNKGSCSGVDVMFVDCVDPAVRDEVCITTLDATGAYHDTWYFVGGGAFKVTVGGGTERPLRGRGADDAGQPPRRRLRQHRTGLSSAG